MSRRIFVDTNILIYAVSDDRRASAAQAALLAAHCTSVQTLNEFANVARRKMARSAQEIAAATRQFRAVLQIEALTIELHDAAIEHGARYGFSFFDALIVAAALAAGCDTLYTEDLQHRQLIDQRLRIVNPFA